MAEIRLQEIDFRRFGRVDNEDDLELPPALFHINPPPPDGRCYGCNRQLTELKPFGKAGDPLAGDFSGALLLKTWRAACPRDEDAERIYEKYFNEAQTDSDYRRAKQLMALHYGQEEAERIISRVQAAGCVGHSWECRDCIILSDEDFYEKLRSRMNARM